MTRKIGKDDQASNDELKKTAGAKKRARSTIPKFPLAETVRVAQAIEDTNAGQPLPPVETALALDLSPRNSDFEQITSASIKYGLTAGNSRADAIAITDLGQRVVSPTSEEAKAGALLAAALEPETFKKMYEYFKGKKLPEMEFFVNTIVREFEIPREHAPICAKVFTMNMELVGLVKTRGDARYLSTQSQPIVAAAPHANEDTEDNEFNDDPDQGRDDDRPAGGGDGAEVGGTPAVHTSTGLSPPVVNRKVFISHGKNRKIVEQVKELLSFGDFEPVVSVEKETTSKPVPDKVMDDMRECGAGIINVGSERKVIDQQGEEHVILNQNVLIEIGAAMALYAGRFILLVEKGVELPSNLQGLYQVRYEGEELGGDATIKLLKAFNEFKTA